MKILAIETSCDETAAAVVEGTSLSKPVKVLSSVVASSKKMHIKTKGIVPEVAAREQVCSIVQVVNAAIENGKLTMDNLDVIAVTVGPGLMGSLLVGVETAKTLAYVWQKPIVPVNHLVAHLYGGWVRDDKADLKSVSALSSKVPEFPALGLVVSGGHTDLVLMKGHGKLEWLGGTRDDAAGECFDKCARLLGLEYPGGPAIAEKAMEFTSSKHQVTNRYRLPRPLINSDDYDFSFSGLKTAVARQAAELKMDNGKLRIPEMAYEVQEAIVDVLVAKVMKAVEEFKPKSVIVGGGVAANSRLKQELEFKIDTFDNLPAGKAGLSASNVKLFIPPPELCTDNAVTIATAAFYNNSPVNWKEIQPNPGLEIVSS